MMTWPDNAFRKAADADFGPKLVTAIFGPLAQKMIERDERLISPSYTRGYPLAVKCGRGVRVEDVDGNQVP